MVNKIIGKNLSNEKRDLVNSLLNNFVRNKKKRNIIRALECLARFGYVFHGSRKKFDVVRPHNAKGAWEENSLCCIYAAKDAHLAIFYSIVDFREKYFIDRHDKSISLFEVSRKGFNKLGSGYIYVLEGKYFKRNCLDEICHKKVKPVIIIKTEPADFKKRICLIEKRKIDWKKVGKLMKKNQTYKGKIHGVDHTLRVIRNAAMIAKVECPDSYNDVLIGAAFHDIGRSDDVDRKNLHGRRGYTIAKDIFRKYFINEPYRFKEILIAIKYHPDGLVSKNLIIGSIWDADRLDLVRSRKKIDLNLLSTMEAKRIANRLNRSNAHFFSGILKINEENSSS